MADKPEFVVEDARNAVLKLRTDLIVSPRSSGEWSGYFIEDPLRGKFFRVGLAEHAVLSLLDGGRTISQACGEAASRLGPAALNDHDSLAVCRWALDAQLVQPVNRDDTRRLTKQAGRISRLKLRAAFNPLCARLPLGNPNRLVEVLAPRLGWIFNRPAFLTWAVVIVYAIYLIATDFDRFSRDSQVVFSRENWWVLAAVWVGLKIVHETAHALACRTFGGHVTQAGIMFLLLVPVPYVDVTSTWRLADKWQRIIVAAAGMYVELFVAAAATFVWAGATSAETCSLAQSVIITAALGTLLFNANPLMRFDGYYILADWLEIPNLSARGNQYLIGFAERCAFGTRRSANTTVRERRIVATYSAFSLVWRVFACTMVLLALGALVARWHPIAAYAAVGAILLGFAYRGVKGVWLAVAAAQPISRGRMVAVSAGALAICGVLSAWLFGPAAIRAHGIVEYAPLVVVRAGAAGFVERLLVSDGDWIEAGREIARLSNDELSIRLRDVELEIQQSEIRLRLHRQAEELAKEQAETAKLQALKRKRDEIAEQAGSLVVKAPSAGQVVARDLDSLVGRYLAKGDVVATLGDSRVKEVVVAVPEYDVEAAFERQSATVTVRVDDIAVAPFQAVLTSVEPRATVHPPHEALAATAGGPLAVRLRDDGEDRAEDDELVQGCFKARVALTGEESERLHAGQLAVIQFRTSEQSVAERLVLSVSRFVDQRLSATSSD